MASNPKNPLRILQISDSHLFADPKGSLLGVETLSALQAVIALAKAEAGDLDLILATGDLVQDHSTDGYHLVQQQLSSFGVPVYALPGNHDDAALMQKQLVGGQVSMPFAVRHGHWLLIQLDSSQPGSEVGHLSAATLTSLQAELSANPDAQVLISVHHQPVPVGSPWLDTMMIDNADRLFEILDTHTQVRALIFGHVHQVFEGRYKDIQLFGCPATCFQFTQNQPSFGLDAIPPGCRLLELSADGRIESRVMRLPELPQGIDYSSQGY